MRNGVDLSQGKCREGHVNQERPASPRKSPDFLSPQFPCSKEHLGIKLAKEMGMRSGSALPDLLFQELTYPFSVSILFSPYGFGEVTSLSTPNCERFLGRLLDISWEMTLNFQRMTSNDRIGEVTIGNLDPCDEPSCLSTWLNQESIDTLLGGFVIVLSAFCFCLWVHLPCCRPILHWYWKPASSSVFHHGLETKALQESFRPSVPLWDCGVRQP